MNDINRNLPPPTQVPFGGAWGDKVPEAKHREESVGRTTELDVALVEHYLGASRKGVQVTIDSTHLAQLCNEVWRRRREEREDRSVGVAELAKQERDNRLAEIATKAVADVGFAPGIRDSEARAIMMVANLLAEAVKSRKSLDSSVMLIGGAVHGTRAAVEYVRGAIAELMEWREEHQRSLAYRFPNGAVIYGKPEAIDELTKQQAELESARRIIQELERMGWLMKAAKAATP